MYIDTPIDCILYVFYIDVHSIYLLVKTVICFFEDIR